MSKLEELIAEHCPDGVEHRMLYETADLTMGTSPSGSTISTEPSYGIEFHQGKTFFGNMMLGHSNMYTSAPVKEAEAGSIVMSVRAPVGDTNIHRNSFKKDIAHRTSVVNEPHRTSSEYMFYALSNFSYMIYSKGAKMPRRLHEISVPPLPVLKLSAFWTISHTN
ncbi:hypothetical protein [Aminivibrio sp.]|uniref:hypothetical protein n=1 Tax=Aminivibrio sp. TaxID=1872489 RepID=UPI00345EB7A5